MPAESFDHGREFYWPVPKKSPAIGFLIHFQKQENLYINCGQFQEGSGVISADSLKNLSRTTTEPIPYKSQICLFVNLVIQR